MKLEDQVCSLELAKRLKELGMKQESLLRWEVGIRGAHILWPRDPNERVIDTADVRQYYSAFTVAELGEMLPKGMPGNGHIEGTALHIGRKYEGEWFCGYSVHDISRGSEYPHTEWLHNEIAETEADARAKMLVYLIENNLLTPNPTS